jgi:asparagine synthase (glutamine-hydrolysing)
MCGFAGFIDYRSTTSPEVLNAMASCLVHRGPDDSGLELLHLEKAAVGMGFRRLSILDLSQAGHQPMFAPDRSLVIMLNGEIYNFREIRSELEKEGVQFKSESDTEVVLHSYRKWGMKMLDRFVGMFAIVLVDVQEQKVYMARDRAGVKPLFYHCADDLILFGSELKAFHQHPQFKKEINLDALALYFQNGSIPAPYSIFKNTFKVVPGNWICLDLKTRDISSREYWNAFDAYNAEPLRLDYNEAMTITESMLQSACDYRMIADVPVGVFLSGGYDSTAVTALLTRTQSVLNTYTIGFEDAAYNEANHARKVAAHLGTNHHEYICTVKDAQEIVPLLPDIYDEPFGDSSAIPTTLVSRIARKYVTVALSADAGDEVFAGYPRHIKARNYLNRLESFPGISLKLASPLSLLLERYNAGIEKADIASKVAGLLRANGPLEVFNVINQTYSPVEIKRLLKKSANSLKTVFNEGDLLNAELSPLTKVLAAEYRTYLTDDILQKVDRATMSASLEGREPFLDHRLLELVARLPENFKLDGVNGKRILKDIVHKYVPREIMERPKMGFGVPVASWLRGDLRKLFDEVMDESKIEQQGILNVKTIAKLKRAYLEGRLSDGERMWYVFSFQLWYNRWMN